MKKIFSIFAAALVALSFASCKKGGSEPEVKSKDFQLSVSNVTAVSANVAVVPTDLQATYYIGIEPSENLSKAALCLDSLGEYTVEYIDLMIQYAAMLGETYTYDDFLFKGELKAEDGLVEGLMPETEYVAYVFKLDDKGKYSGELAYVTFTTKKAEVKKTEALKLNGILYDATETEGYWELLAAPADSSVVLYLSPDYAEQIAGKYNATDLNEYSWMYFDGAEEELALYAADVTVAVSGKQATISGTAMFSNMVQYELDIKAQIEEYDWSDFFAPARKAPARRVEGLKLRPRIRK